MAFYVHCQWWMAQLHSSDKIEGVSVLHNDQPLESNGLANLVGHLKHTSSFAQKPRQECIQMEWNLAHPPQSPNIDNSQSRQPRIILPF